MRRFRGGSDIGARLSELALRYRPCFAFRFDQGRISNLISGEVNTLTSPWAPSQDGITPGTSTTHQTIAADATTIIPTDEISVVWVAQQADAVDESSSEWGLNGGTSAYRCTMSFPWFNGNLYWDFGGTGGTHRYTWGMPSTDLTKRYVGACRAGDLGMQVYLNGSAIGPGSSSAVGGRTASTDAFQLGGLSGSKDRTHYALFGFHSQMPDALFATLRDQKDVYEAFLAPRRLVVKVPAAGGTTTLVAASGSYTLTGTAAMLLHNKVLAAAAGSYTLTGTDVTTLISIVMQASAGSYTISGTAANLLYNRLLQAAAGSYTLTGTAANLLVTILMVASAGSYTISGTATTTLYNRLLQAGTGNYTISGTATNLLYNRLMQAGSGAYVLTGTAATTIKSIVLAAGSGAYTVTGTDASTLRALLLQALAGSYALTGTSVTTSTAGVTVIGFVDGQIVIYAAVEGEDGIYPAVDGEKGIYPAIIGTIKVN